MFPSCARRARSPIPERDDRTPSPATPKNPPQSELLSLAKRLIAYETCDERSIHECAGFVEAWLEAREIEATREIVRGLPVVKAEVGPSDAPTIVLEGHID